MPLKFKLRDPETDLRYQTHKALGESDEMLADWQNRIVEEFTYWVIIENKFPWTRITKLHHLLIPKRRFARVEDMTTDEKAEWETIRKIVRDKYDMFIENMLGATVSDLYHPHLILLKDETDQVYFDNIKEAEKLKQQKLSTDAQYPASA